MKNRLSLSLIFIFISLNSFAFNLTGRVQNTNGMAIPYANVVAYMVSDSTFISGTTTDINGRFSLFIDADSCILKVSTVGYQSYEKQYKNGEIDIIVLEENTQILSEIVVSGRLPTYKLTREGLLTNVAGTVLGKIGTAEDVLKHIPSVIKKDDHFEVFGKGTPNIYINGRKVLNIDELDNIKAEDVKSVEVIRNPGALYDASVKSVLKIKTNVTTFEGLGIDVRSVYYNNKYNNTIDQVNLNYHNKNINIFATYKYSNRKRIEDAELEQTIYVDTLWHQKNQRYSTTREEIHSFIVGGSYNINQNHSFGARGSLAMQSFQKGVGTTFTELDVNEEFYDCIQTNGVERGNNKPSYQLNMYYNGKIGKTSVNFSTDLLSKETISKESRLSAPIHQGS